MCVMYVPSFSLVTLFLFSSSRRLVQTEHRLESIGRWPVWSVKESNQIHSRTFKTGSSCPGLALWLLLLVVELTIPPHPAFPRKTIRHSSTPATNQLHDLGGGFVSALCQTVKQHILRHRPIFSESNPVHSKRTARLLVHGATNRWIIQHEQFHLGCMLPKQWCW